MTDTSNHRPEAAGFTVERYLCEDLSGEEHSQFEALLETSSEMQSLVTEERAARAAFQNAQPYASFLSAHRRRVAESEKPRSIKRQWILSPVLAAAMLVAFFTFGPTTEELPQENIILKGDSLALTMSRVEGDSVLPVHSGDSLGATTTLVVHYHAGPHSHMALVGVDGSGRASVYFATPDEKLRKLDEQSRGTLPLSLELDATPGKERFFGIYGDGPDDLSGVLDALRSGRDLATIEPSVVYREIWFIKR
jgi:hypothetical protein|tara:strand:+ start:436 stop:1188 length:753 start_codon:yes stop_codon:yes gene_type:complete